MREGSILKISVIIPVYNAEKYLDQCLQSLLQQTLQDFEILCIDDGSTDNSLVVLNQYAKNYTNVKVYQQQNLHAGVARNKGIKESQGDYLAFVDADDFVEPDYLELQYNRLIETDADICICDVDNYNMQSGSFSSSSFISYRLLPNKEVFNKGDLKDNLFLCFISSPCNKMLKKSFLQENGIFFQETFHSNDVYFSQISLALADKITVLREKVLYHYRIGLKDNIQSSKSKFSMDGPYALMHLYEQLIERRIYLGSVRDSFGNFVLNLTVWFMQQAMQEEKALMELYHWMMEHEMFKDIDYHTLSPHAMLGYRLFLYRKREDATTQWVRLRLLKFISGNSGKWHKVVSLIHSCVILKMPLYPFKWFSTHRL